MNYERTVTQDPMAFDDRVQFVLHVAGLALEGLRHGDWLNLRDDCYAFLRLMIIPEQEPRLFGLFSVRGIGSEVTDFPDSLAGFQRFIRAMQPEVQAALDAVAVTLDAEGHPDHAESIAPLHQVPRPEVEVKYGTHILVVYGSARMVLRWHLHYLLTHLTLGKIGRCRECQGLFLRVKRQAYCSRPCTNRASQRRFRERQHQPDAHEESDTGASC